MSAQSPILSNLKNKYIRLRVFEILLLTLSSGILIFCILTIFNVTATYTVLIPVIIGVLVGVIRFYHLGLSNLDITRITQFLNLHYPTLEQSSDLLTTSDSLLTGLEIVQKNKTSGNLSQIQSTITLPNHIRSISAILLVSIAVLILVQQFDLRLTLFDKAEALETASLINSNIDEVIPAAIKDVRIKITPPVYTNLSSLTSNHLAITTIEESSVEWKFTFNKDLSKSFILLSTKDTLWLKKSNQDFSTNLTVTESGFYQIFWFDSIWLSSDYFKIEATRDKEPSIQIIDLPQFYETSHTENTQIKINTFIEDDFGIDQAYIIATVAKGSGESVKFREEKLAFTSPAVTKGKSVKASRNLDLLKLGMEPGDELYFYVEALDNKMPRQNKSRTETYFISLRDTAEAYMTSDAGLGVDLMPEYFRSQRQIIIDTEKLLRNKKVLSKHDFNFTSNELGYDQKVLRLRYGQFLGEEFESGIAVETSHDHENEEEEEDPTKKFGHVHDSENEHNLVPEKDHAKKGDQKENPLDEFLHNHDDAEEATFFVQSLKAKLKAALTQMWDAELYLRLYEPEKSLPFQYKALQLLKEISNDSRIYVHRTGFDPPPIKEEKRLSADLDEVQNSKNTYQLNPEVRYPNIVKALPILERLIASKVKSISTKENLLLSVAGGDLASAAIEHPGKYLSSLSLLKALIDGKIESKDFQNSLLLIRRDFWEVVPTKNQSATSKERQSHALNNKFIEQLYQ